MGDLLDSAVRDPREDIKIYGVLVGEVVSNLDLSGLGRVQLRLPGFPGYQPWARVVAFAAGSGRGAYFIPQTGEEVLVAFHHGDVREPFVIGCLWNGNDRPPRSAPLDPVNLRVIRTPIGHEIALDDALQSIAIESSTGHKFKMDPQGIEISTGAAKITLSADGAITIEGVRVSVKASAALDAKGANVEVAADASATFKASGLCTIQGAQVKIN